MTVKKKAVAIKVSGAVKLDEKKALVEQSKLAAQVTALQVTDQRTYDQAQALIKPIKTYINRMTEVLQPGLDALNQARSVILAQKDKYIKPAEKLESQIKAKMADFEVAQDVVREREMAEANAEAEELNEREKARLLKMAAQIKDPIKKAQLLGQAETLTATPNLPTVAVEKAAGVSSRDDIEITVTNLRAFMGYVYQNTNSPMEPIVTVKIGGIKEFLKFHGLTECPGLTTKKTKVISVKGDM